MDAAVRCFLSALRAMHPDLERQCLHGSCFRLYLLLKEAWPEAEAWYNSDHVITKIGNKFYDIRGEVAPEGHIRMKGDAGVFNRAYYWGSDQDEIKQTKGVEI
jgi:hypothetical protein